MGRCSRRQDGLRKQGISFFSSDSLDCREIWRYEDMKIRVDVAISCRQELAWLPRRFSGR